MIIKTWECIEKKPSLRSKESKNFPFHIKTLRIYDGQNNEVDRILTEQVDAKISPKNFYDTSIIQYKDKIYYFKRIYEETIESSQEGTQKSLRSRMS